MADLKDICSIFKGRVSNWDRAVCIWLFHKMSLQMQWFFCLFVCLEKLNWSPPPPPGSAHWRALSSSPPALQFCILPDSFITLDTVSGGNFTVSVWFDWAKKEDWSHDTFFFFCFFNPNGLSQALKDLGLMNQFFHLSLQNNSLNICWMSPVFYPGRRQTPFFFCLHQRGHKRYKSNQNINAQSLVELEVPDRLLWYWTREFLGDKVPCWWQPVRTLCFLNQAIVI